jgi:hypothetical protein
MALIANLPRHLVDRIGLDSGVLMALLGVMVVIALFLYVRFFSSCCMPCSPSAPTCRTSGPTAWASASFRCWWH